MRKVPGIAALSFLFTLVGMNLSVNKTPCEMAAAVMESQKELPELVQLTAKDADFFPYLTDYYHLDAGQVEDGVIYYADGVEATEISVLVLADAKEGEAVRQALEKYIMERASAFGGYAPLQAAMAKDGLTVLKDRHIALLICKDVRAARTAFLRCFEEKGAAEAASIPNEYNSEAVLRAWRTGDETPLSKTNRDILAAAKETIQQVIRDGMTDYEKELAIHDWITHWSSFDFSIFGRSGKVKAGTDTPYGVLILREAMCHGYSSTFQLFMDMLNIECITVFGTPDSRGVRHSWNMVRLDGEWYCVDTAWDDPIGGSPSHRFFNVTSDTLRKSGIHRWDDAGVPEARATVHRFGR